MSDRAHGTVTVRAMSDTDAPAEAMRLVAVRARSPELRLRDALDLSELMQAAVMAKLRERFPTKSVVELSLLNLARDATAEKL